MRTKAETGILVADSCSTGTAFLLELLTALGLDVVSAVAPSDCSAIAPVGAGPEEEPGWPDTPRSMVFAYPLNEVDELLARDAAIRHVSVPMTSDAAIPEESEPAGEQNLAGLLKKLARHDIAITLVSFPRFLTDAAYLYSKLAWLIPGVSFTHFSRCHAKMTCAERVLCDEAAQEAHSYKATSEWPIDEELFALSGPSGILATQSIVDQGVVGIGSAFRDQAAEYDERYYNDEAQRAVFRKALAFTGRRAETIVGPVLDLGCGSGNSTFAILEEVKGAVVLASDLSPEMLEILLKRADERGVTDRITAFVANAENLRVSRGSCDVIVGSSMIHHMMAPGAFLAKVLQALKSGGFAYFIEPFQAGHFALRQSIAALVEIAGVKNDLDPKYVGFLRQYVFAIDTIMKEQSRDPDIYAQLEDKWLFPRSFFETAGQAENCDLTIFSVSPSNQGTYHAIVDLIYAGTGDRIELPPWAFEMLSSNDALLTPDLREELLHVGCIVFHKRRPNGADENYRPDARLPVMRRHPASASRQAYNKTTPETFDGRFTLDLPGFVHEYPDDKNSYKLREGKWKFDFDRLSREEIDHFMRTVDNRPLRCAELFPGFSDFRIAEFGPSDGYNAAQLEIYGATDITSFEANVDAFLRCVILKNTLNLKTKFMLGDFLEFTKDTAERFDLAYASGVLYHLLDPVSFLVDCGRIANHLFIWSLYYDESAIDSKPEERARFNGIETRTINDESFTYYTRFVEAGTEALPKYQGAINDRSVWMTIDDIRKAIKLAGFEIIEEVPANLQGLKATNIWASKPRFQK